MGHESLGRTGSCREEERCIDNERDRKRKRGFGTLWCEMFNHSRSFLSVGEALRKGHHRVNNPEGLTGALRRTAFSASLISLRVSQVAVQHNQTPHRVADGLGRHLSSPQDKVSSQAGGTTRPTCCALVPHGGPLQVEFLHCFRQHAEELLVRIYPVLLRWVAESSMGLADQSTVSNDGMSTAAFPHQALQMRWKGEGACFPKHHR